MDKRLAPGHKANRAVEKRGTLAGVDHPQDSSKLITLLIMAPLK